MSDGKSKEIYAARKRAGAAINEAAVPDFLGELSQSRKESRSELVLWLRDCMIDCIQILARRKFSAAPADEPRPGEDGRLRQPDARSGR